MSLRTFTYTNSVSAATHCRLDAFLRQQSMLWNDVLEERIECHRMTGETISAYDQCKSLTEIRNEFDEFSQFHVQCQRSVLFRLDKAFKSFFRRVKAGGKPGFPRFKGQGRQIRSFDVPSPIIKDGSLRIKGIGRFRIDAEEGLQVKAARVVKSALRVSVQLICEVEDSHRPQDSPIVIDMGLKHRAIFSTGETIDRVKLDRRGLKRRQRKLSRSKRASNTGRKKVRTAQKEWERTRNRERQSLHRISADIVRRHNMIAVENLQIGNMVNNHCVARAITEQQWGQVGHQLICKAESAGGEVVQVDPRHSSTDCSRCGCRRTMPLSVREYVCNECGLVLDRDVNAARNILRRGMSLAGWEIGSLSHPGVSEDVGTSDVAGLPGQDTERYSGSHSLTNCYHLI